MKPSIKKKSSQPYLDNIACWCFVVIIDCNNVLSYIKMQFCNPFNSVYGLLVLYTMSCIAALTFKYEFSVTYEIIT